MLAITVIPGKQGSVGLSEMPEPPASDGPILVDTQAVGICGTDIEIINGEYGAAPPGEDRLIIGHESLGRVAEAPAGSGFSAGDLVVGIVRRPDPVPCPACAAGDWDMCTNGRYTERGIMGRHGFAAQRYRIHPEYLVAVDPALGTLGVLLEPATVVAKAWDHIEKIGHRFNVAPQARADHRRRADRPAGGAAVGAARATRPTCSTWSPRAVSRTWSAGWGPAMCPGETWTRPPLKPTS